MIHIREHVPLAPFTSFNVGGPARFFVKVADQTELEEAVRVAEEKVVPVFILVGGSNVVVSDEGFHGMVIRMEMKGMEATHEGEDVFIRAGAGESWDALVAWCVAEEWSGLECLSGIPGSVGAAPVQNIGAYGVSVAPFVHEVEVFDRTTKKIIGLSGDECVFSYRDSIFKHPEGSSYIVTHVTFRLTRSRHAAVPAYHDLKEFFGDQTEASLATLRAAIIEIRSRKGMVLLPGYETYKSAGSFFKNPVVSVDVFSRVESAIRACPDGACTPPWYWTQTDGTVKLAAACLLEAAGFPKGYRQGRVGISPKHALAIINLGDARAAEIIALAENIEKKVRDQFGVMLEREAQCIGFPS